MAEEKKAPQDKQNRIISANAQFIKDLSFENPNAPQSLTNLSEAPQIDVSVDVQVTKMNETLYEVTLITNTKAEDKEGNPLFLCELAYSGIFTVDMPKEERDGVLMVYCPSLLFPFSRRIVADLTRDSGFPPLMLDPIDFGGLYQQHIARQAQEKKANSA